MNSRILLGFIIVSIFYFLTAETRSLYPELEPGNYKLKGIFCKEDLNTKRPVLSRYKSTDDVEKVMTNTLDFDNVISKIIHVDHQNFSISLSTLKCTSKVTVPVMRNGDGFLQLDFGRDIAYEKEKQCLFLKTTHGKERQFNDEGDFLSRSEFMTEYWRSPSKKSALASISKKNNTYLLTFKNNVRKFIPCSEVVWELIKKN